MHQPGGLESLAADPSRHATRGLEWAASPARIRVLFLDDSADDAEMIVYMLKRNGFEPRWKRVASEAAFRDNLDQTWDLVASDYELPQYDGIQALRLFRDSNLSTPFLLVTSVLLPEIEARAMAAGATACMAKDSFAEVALAIAEAVHIHPVQPSTPLPAAVENRAECLVGKLRESTGLAIQLLATDPEAARSQLDSVKAATEELATELKLKQPAARYG